MHMQYVLMDGRQQLCMYARTNKKYIFTRMHLQKLDTCHYGNQDFKVTCWSSAIAQNKFVHVPAFTYIDFFLCAERC